MDIFFVRNFFMDLADLGIITPRIRDLWLSRFSSTDTPECMDKKFDDFLRMNRNNHQIRNFYENSIRKYFKN